VSTSYHHNYSKTARLSSSCINTVEHFHDSDRNTQVLASRSNWLSWPTRILWFCESLTSHYKARIRGTELLTASSLDTNLRAVEESQRFRQNSLSDRVLFHHPRKFWQPRTRTSELWIDLTRVSKVHSWSLQVPESVWVVMPERGMGMSLQSSHMSQYIGGHDVRQVAGTMNVLELLFTRPM